MKKAGNLSRLYIYKALFVNFIALRKQPFIKVERIRVFLFSDRNRQADKKTI